MSSRTKQSGTVIPYVLAVIIALLLASQYVFDSYKLSNESTRMQNTTDAAAYSVAAVYAQNYNFAALSNRALVANQITMAQVVTLVSWSRLLKTFATTINDIGQFIPWITAVTNAMEQYATRINDGVELIAPAATQIIQAYIEFVTLEQKTALSAITTTLIAQEILKDVVEANDPDVDYSLATVSVGAETVAHLSNYYSNDCQNQADEVREVARATNEAGGDVSAAVANAGDQEVIERCRQFRNVTLASRDGFTKDRTYRFAVPGMPKKILIPGKAAELVGGPALYAELSIERAGGTTMGGDTPGVTNATPFTTWSALDSISLHSSTTYLDIDWRGVDIETTRHKERVKLGVAHAYVGNECSHCHHVIHEGKNYWNKNPAGSSCTDPDYEREYGPGRKSLNDDEFVLMDVFSLNCGELSDEYGQSINEGENAGLTDFYNFKQEGYVEKADHLMVYLRKDRTDVGTASETVGGMNDEYRLDRYESAYEDHLHGAAAAGVFFRRSNDRWMRDSAKRNDGKMEFGNMYNPFWEPRLTKLKASDKATLEVMMRD